MAVAGEEKGVNRVVYDIKSKPSGAIEWEWQNPTLNQIILNKSIV